MTWIVGNGQQGGTPRELVADTKLVSTFHVTEDGFLPKLVVCMDGLGAGVGDQVVRGVIYDNADVLVAESDEVTVVDGSGAAWYALGFLTDFRSGVRVLAAQDYRFGVHAGAVSNAARVFQQGPNLAGSKSNADTYADGAAAAFGASSAEPLLSVFAPHVNIWTPPDASDLYYSRLPFPEAQAVIGAIAPPITPAVASATCGWHGTRLDPEEGSVAVVDADGPLADLVGERILVSVTRSLRHPHPSVAAYVHTDYPLPDPYDVSLSRKLFSALGVLALTSLDVRVDVL